MTQLQSFNPSLKKYKHTGMINHLFKCKILYQYLKRYSLGFTQLSSYVHAITTTLL